MLREQKENATNLERGFLEKVLHWLFYEKISGKPPRRRDDPFNGRHVAPRVVRVPSTWGKQLTELPEIPRCPVVSKITCGQLLISIWTVTQPFPFPSNPVHSLHFILFYFVNIGPSEAAEAWPVCGFFSSFCTLGLWASTSVRGGTTTEGENREERDREWISLHLPVVRLNHPRPFEEANSPIVVRHSKLSNQVGLKNALLLSSIKFMFWVNVVMLKPICSV